MTPMRTRILAELIVGGQSFVLATDQDVDEIKNEIEDAAATSAGRFVNVRGDRTALSVFVSRGVDIAVITKEVAFEEDDEESFETADDFDC